MKRKPDNASTPLQAEAPAESNLVLRRRPVASLDEDQLSDAAGGHPHTCDPTCPPTCCGDTCQATCDQTCGATCHYTCDLEVYTCVITACGDPIP